MKIGFIGCGNMGGAMLTAMLKQFSRENWLENWKTLEQKSYSKKHIFLIFEQNLYPQNQAYFQ